MPLGGLPAIDRMVALGVTGPTRVGVFGQSYGGYSVTGLLTQTDRFVIGVAIAGINDLASNFGQFDPIARDYPGIEHEKSSNTSISDLFGLRWPPWDVPAAYARNSPLSHVKNVKTPLLMLTASSGARPLRWREPRPGAVVH